TTDGAEIIDGMGPATGVDGRAPAVTGGNGLVVRGSIGSTSGGATGVGVASAACAAMGDAIGGSRIAPGGGGGETGIEVPVPGNPGAAVGCGAKSVGTVPGATVAVGDAGAVAVGNVGIAVGGTYVGGNTGTANVGVPGTGTAYVG